MFILIQIPCLNEEGSVGEVIRGIPREIEGAGRVEILLIDDGSSDQSVEQARAAGADHIIRFPGTRGLARVFEAGIDSALRMGADIIVNIDGDGQYRGSDIPKLVEPIISGKADMVIGDRGIARDRDYPPIKKALQIFGSWSVRVLSNTQAPDATSGFRAYSKEAAQRINIVSDFTYTLESIIQAGKDKLSIESAAIQTNEVKRPSRLFSSMGEYLAKSAKTMVRIYSMYEPLKFFSIIGGSVFAAGFLIGLWFLSFYLAGDGKGHVQILILAAVLMIMGFQTIIMGLLADLVGANRKLLGDILFRMKRAEREKTETPENK